ncbi:HEAT repeat domain-containing protein [Pyxidicoccus parkwayensis]|uniref:HEAT repeat domain-containing protein n=1 Tax=Pyxidicoccus parkwayensis TaxID=2813578 RepID=A0ABX7P7N3_9BACT|nr:HEAT repeat domain-containing protein [Pyxidicoccus parkwaysis]QSQ26451.1 HEAT repeat domain-containing protein [Pyxidicoccus parkwaysis]
MPANQEMGGRAALQGFAYQEAVTVWVALELMFAQNEGIERIELEPESQEDLAVLLPAPGQRRLLSIQVKFRSKPWGKVEFVDVVGIPRRPPSTRGPQRRLSPVERLAANPGEHYLLITNATLDTSIQSLQVRGLLDPAPAPRLPASLKRRLPPGLRLEELAPRITVLQPKDEEHIQLLTQELLKRHLHVPGLDVRRCREALVEEVRARMLPGVASRFWTKQDIVATARRYMGSLAPTEELEDFVAPRNFEAMKSQLESRHLLVLLGPPGVGKTLVARKLAYEYETADEPFAFARIQDPIALRERLEATREPTVFFVEDPFGPDRPGDKADRWLHALPGLLDEAGPDKKIIVMSRMAVLRASSEKPQFQQLQSEAMHLDASDYDASTRWRILQNKLKRVEGWQRALVDDHRDEVLERLHVPLSIKTFAAKVRQLNPRDVLRLPALLQESGVDRIASIVAREVRGLPWKAVPPALVLWSLLTRGPVLTLEAALTRSDVILGADRSLDVDFRKLLDWMLAAGWLTEEPEGYRAHPQVTAGLKLLPDEEPAQATAVFSALFKGMLAKGDFTDVLSLAGALPYDSRLLSHEAYSAFDAWLRSTLLTAEGASLPELFVTASRWLRGADPVAALLRALLPPPVISRDGFQHLTSWQLPGWPEPLLEDIRSSADARQIMERFIQYVLPGISNVFHEDFVWDLDFLGWDFPEAFAAAAPVVIRHPTNALYAIMLGAVNCASAPFDELIELLCSELNRLCDRVSTSERREAEQGHLDYAEATAINEQDLDDRLMLDDVLERLVARRRTREGHAWLPEHPRLRELIFSWSKAIQPEDASLDEFRALRDACEPRQRWQAYEAIGRTRHTGSAPLLFDALLTAEGYEARACLRALFSMWPPEALHTELSPLLAQPEDRRAALVAIVGTPLPWDERHESSPGVQEALAHLLFPEESTALRACIQAQAKSPWPPNLGTVSADDRERLWKWVRSPSPELHGAALRVLAALGEPIATAASAMLESSATPFREKVIQALSSDVSRESTDLLVRALQDPDSQCRAAAILALAPRADASARRAVLATAKDPSYRVRKACIDAIRTHRWNEGLDTLFELLSDTQDLSLGYTEESRDHEVACSAAQVLVELAPLPEPLVRKVLGFLRGGAQSNPDAIVHQQLMVLFMVQEVDEAFSLLVELLQSPMRRIVRLQAHYPVRKGAAWALLQQIIWHPELAQRLELPPLIEAALHADPVLSGGACLLLGRMGPFAWPGASPALGEAGQWARAFLLGAEWLRAHRALPPEEVRAQLPTQAARCLEWLMAAAPDSTESWLVHPGGMDWLAELAAGGGWQMFLRHYLQLSFHAPPPPGPSVGSMPDLLKVLPYAFFVAPHGDWVQVPPDGTRWPAISTSP